MATPVTLPALGESVTEGTVTRWLKQVGDSIEVDEPLLEVSTDKVDTEIPSPVAGTLLEIRVEEDETVEVGAELAVVGDSSESGGDATPDAGGETAPDAGGEAAADPAAEQPADSDEAVAEDTDESAAEGSGALAKAAATSAPHGDGDRGGEVGDDDSAGAPEEVEVVADTGDADDSGTQVTLPALGESVTEGTVTRWLKQVGDSVEVDEALLEVSTDKVDTEIPSPVAGTVQSIAVQEDETVEVGAVLAVVGTGSAPDGADRAATSAEDTADSGEESPAATEVDAQADQEPPPAQPESADPEPADTSAETATTPPPQSAKEQTTGSASDAPGGPSRSDSDKSSSATDNAPSPGSGSNASYLTPLVRKLAGQHGVDLSAITGTGVGGRIRKQDVLAAAEAARTAAPQQQQADAAPAAATPAPDTSGLRGETVKMTRLRRTIATRMVESLQVSAQLTTVVEVDVSRIARLRGRVKEQFEQREGVKLSFLPFFAKASVEALKAFPMVNASIDTEAGTVTYHGAEHLGVAVDTERGLLVPVIKEAGDLSIAGLARRIADLAARTRDSKIGPDELSGGTFTLTNTGSRGALFDTPIINQPQVAILGTGAVVKRAVVLDNPDVGETIGIRSMAYLSLTYDHRIVDGADAARFLSAIKARLEEAAFESDLGL
ncbi:MAG: Dihydrolipoamide acetyltransferase component of pyruvate dehydrogenase complex [uncultured Nocardioidaceae bacterium]|uniref:Dihydrolipoamide acetyltransferase component of pyruvate dehydrogenase complex n=1 Tax=uncultured Nocardioidaceae bacterium TaxID=253824 RepID=A0A6J4LDY8_9ACTN|nr:MAG: Dihydrolipoamide acetyltransferase component of pyruvate dehydrogenase complex [uncultured Nocardioidaceae bacterium]